MEKRYVVDNPNVCIGKSICVQRVNRALVLTASQTAKESTCASHKYLLDGILS